jgi:hypothetical protein
MNVHNYDSQVKHLEIKTIYNADIKMTIFKWLLAQLNKYIEKFPHNMYIGGCRGLALIIDDMQQPSNYSTDDTMYADDVLAEICIKIVGVITEEDKLIDIYTNIIEQMDDMYNKGRCASGRVIRLVQIYQIINDMHKAKTENKEPIVVV